MKRAERWAAGIWGLSGAWSLVAFASPGFATGIVVLLILIGIGIPLAWLLWQMPTVFLYLTAAALIYLPLRRRSRRVGVAAAVGIVGLAVIAIPVIGNRQAERLVEAEAARDRGGPVLLPPGKRVAYLYDWGPDFDWNSSGCEDICQRLLLSGVAGEVLLGDVSALQGGRTLTRYWIGPRRGSACPAPRLSKAYADERDVGRDAPFPRPFLSKALPRLLGEGRCLYEAKASVDEADIVLFSQFLPMIEADGLSLIRLTHLERNAVFIRSGGRLQEVMRRSFAEGARLTVPLALDAPEVFNTYKPARWRASGRFSAGRRYSAALSELITNDLRVTGLR